MDEISEGEALKRAGMEQVDDNADPDWKEAMFAIVVEVAKRKIWFTTDDVFALAEERGIPTTHDRRAMGPVMMRVAKHRIAKKSRRPFRNSKRPDLHCTPLQVWASLLVPGAWQERLCKCCKGEAIETGMAR